MLQLRTKTFTDKEYIKNHQLTFQQAFSNSGLKSYKYVHFSSYISVNRLNENIN